MARASKPAVNQAARLAAEAKVEAGRAVRLADTALDAAARSMVVCHEARRMSDSRCASVEARVRIAEREVRALRAERQRAVARMERCAVAALGVGASAFLACALFGVAWPYGVAVFSLAAAAAVAITSDCMGPR